VGRDRSGQGASQLGAGTRRGGAGHPAPPLQSPTGGQFSRPPARGRPSDRLPPTRRRPATTLQEIGSRFAKVAQMMTEQKAQFP